jgi:tetratricopeptide (TPR) repeat protein
MAASGGGYQMGFTLTPLMEGDLDTSGDFKGGPHPAEEDPLYKMACENRDGGNKMVKDGSYEGAIAKYSELIMQLRALSEETDVVWDDEGTDAVRQLRAAAYLNLSLCFLKTQQWQHASNTATRALQGDKDPPVPEESVLSPEKKAKALFRRAQAQSEGFTNHDKAVDDLKKALEYTPDDKAVQQELRRVQQILTKSEKAADKKMQVFSRTAKRCRMVTDFSTRSYDHLTPVMSPS